ncbi:MAG TPA: hypothetical protein QF624_07425 [Dehalococcoidia bacterium]|nr:hypothetical protein [Dehalococcoidia bacterium]
MPEQYVAKDNETGLEISVTGDFPEDPDDRVRIARTATLFTRLFSTILSTESITERRQRFRAVESQLEIADALIKEDFTEVQQLMRETMHSMGVSEEQLAEIEAELKRHLKEMGGIDFPDATDEDAPPDEDGPPAP